MMRTATRTLTGALAALAVTASLVACGGDDEESAAALECPEVELPEGASSSERINWSVEVMDARDEGTCLTDADAEAFASGGSGGAEEETTTSSAVPDPSGPGSITARDSIVQEDASSVQQRRVYRNSEDYRFLEYDGAIVPGGMYYVDNGNRCSFGWTVGMEDDGERLLNLTAGHCGEVGDKVYVQSSQGEPVYVGEFVWSDYGGEQSVGTGPDYGLIEFYDEYHEYVNSTPSVSMDGTPVDIQGWAGVEWLEENEPYMCRLGFRSGLSCGSFRQMANDITVEFDNVSDGGDSGGVIWAHDPSDRNSSNIYAVAVNSFRQDHDATMAGGKVIEPVMESHALRIRK